MFFLSRDILSVISANPTSLSWRSANGSCAAIVLTFALKSIPCLTPSDRMRGCVGEVRTGEGFLVHSCVAHLRVGKIVRIHSRATNCDSIQLSQDPNILPTLVVPDDLLHMLRKLRHVSVKEFYSAVKPAPFLVEGHPPLPAGSKPPGAGSRSPFCRDLRSVTVLLTPPPPPQAHEGVIEGCGGVAPTAPSTTRTRRYSYSLWAWLRYSQQSRGGRQRRWGSWGKSQDSCG